MQTLTVHASRTYEVLVGRGLLSCAGTLCREVNGGARALLVSDSHVGPLYTMNVAGSLRDAGYTVKTYMFPAGEASKTLDTVAGLYAQLAAGGFTRRDLLVALGGGVTGDMTGFTAATWLRGVDFVQIPTSLLAQVDSSVGGKTGVDLPQGKNLVGAFHQPVRVIADTNTLRTLPEAVWADGMGEVIKTAAIRDAALFAALEQQPPTPETAEDTVARCVAIKRDVVERDEQESGERKLLNFGHTLGHALEQHDGYRTLTHGAAVGLGMVRITRASERQGLTVPGTADRLARLLAACGLPAESDVPLSALLPALKLDKKSAGNGIDLVLLRDIGDSFVQHLEREALPQFLGE